MLPFSVEKYTIPPLQKLVNLLISSFFDETYIDKIEEMWYYTYRIRD